MTKTRVLAALAALLMLFLLALLVMAPAARIVYPGHYDGAVAITVRCRVISDGDATGIPGAVVLSFPEKRFERDANWIERQLTKHRSRTARSRGWSAYAVTNNDGRVSADYTPGFSWGVDENEPEVPRYFAIASIRVSADGYETRIVDTDGAAWTELEGSDPLYVAHFELDLGTIALTPILD